MQIVGHAHERSPVASSLTQDDEWLSKRNPVLVDGDAEHPVVVLRAPSKTTNLTGTPLPTPSTQ